jgi:hypothetical protein
MLYFHSSPSPASVKNAATPGQIRALGHDGAMLLNYLSGAIERSGAHAVRSRLRTATRSSSRIPRTSRVVSSTSACV